MCHEQFHRVRVPDRGEDDDGADGDRVVAWDPSFASEGEPDDGLEVLTDGGDG